MKKRILILTLSMLIASAVYAEAQEHGKDAQVLYGVESQQSFKGPEDWFTGDVQVDMLFPPNETAQYSGAYVTFQPGARTAWHLHKAGQHMIVTSGVALTGTRDGEIIEFKTGDAVWCPPDIDHWHGATPNAPMTHLVLTGVSPDSEGGVVWKEKVTDEEYLGNSVSEGNTLEKDYALTQRQQSIILIAAFTAEGDLNRLKPALIQGLDAGLTINEINEVLVHLYAYTGFPRSLNALFTFMQVLGERKAQGIEDAQGKEASPIPSDLDRDEYGAKVRAGLSGLDTVPPPGQWQLFAPVMDGFLKQHLFADLFVRDVISHQDRELTTIAALANMSATEGQLGYHLGAAMNTGLTQEQMEDFISVLQTSVGNAQAESAQKLLTRVLENRK
jgi:quercetin dioxygenase-like cupin family protein/alkylhydroperoxidase/carboxymuconolactone decarboxylase family protein YurZ